MTSASCRSSAGQELLSIGGSQGAHPGMAQIHSPPSQLQDVMTSSAMQPLPSHTSHEPALKGQDTPSGTSHSPKISASCKGFPGHSVVGVIGGPHGGHLGTAQIHSSSALQKQLVTTSSGTQACPFHASHSPASRGQTSPSAAHSPSFSPSSGSGQLTSVAPVGGSHGTQLGSAHVHIPPLQKQSVTMSWGTQA